MPNEVEIKVANRQSGVTISRGQEDGKLWIAWFTMPLSRRQGHAYRRAAEALRLVANFPEPVWALIRPTNAASLALALKLGFVEVDRDEQNVTFRWDEASHA